MQIRIHGKEQPLSSRWFLPPDVAGGYRQEISLSHAAVRTGDHEGAWRHLERAHILGLIAVWAHIGVHFRMLRFAIVHWDRHEIAGQVLRVVIAGPGSYSGQVPLGDTGGSRAPAPPPPIPEDLRSILRAGGVVMPPAQPV